MDYLFYSEIVHILNLPHLFLEGTVLWVVIGGVLRYVIPTKKAFYVSYGGVLLAWVVCEAVYTVAFAKDIASMVGIAGFCFGLAWILFCCLAGAGITHIVCLLLRKRVLR